MGEDDRLTGSGAERRALQRAFWRSRYLEDPAFFGAGASDFARWCVPWLAQEGRTHEVLELGCGYGRDTRFLAEHGYHVRGVDLTGAAHPAASRAGYGTEIEELDALDCLRRQTAGSLDAVYSNMFFNMDFTEEEHRELFRAVHEALRPDGLHLYSARSTSDPWYGRGRPLGPDRFDPAPQGISMHFFSRAYADRLADALFRPVERLERNEGEGDFPITLLYVVDRRA